MESAKEIAFGNLKGEVVVLRELVKALISRLPQSDDTGRLLEDALSRARESAPDGPDRTSVNYAINQLQVHSVPRG